MRQQIKITGEFQIRDINATGGGKTVRDLLLDLTPAQISQIMSQTASVPDISGNWADKFPHFSLEVTADGYKLVNETGYKTNEEVLKKQSEYLREYSRKNIQEGGEKIKRVLVTICENAGGLKENTFTQGWQPIQNVKYILLNDRIAYYIESESRNSGWLDWYSGSSTENSVLNAVRPLFNLGSDSKYRSYAREALEQRVRTR